MTKLIDVTDLAVVPDAGADEVKEDAPALLDETFSFLGRFVAYPSTEAQVAHVLWVVHCHVMDAWESTPRLAFLSPEPGSGKTRALEITELLVPNAVEAVNVTPAYLFRKIGDEDGPPTLLYDEIDTVFGPKARDNEDIRGLLNAGHRRGAVVGRCVVKGKTIVTEEIPAFCAVALAGLGKLPDTLLSRSIVIRMRRRAPTETVEPYRRRMNAPEGHALRDRLIDWAHRASKRLACTYPDLPDGIEDRDADIWEPLLAIADAVGGDWPERARQAAVSLVSESRESTPSLGVRLLADIREVMGDNAVMSTVVLLEKLNAMEDAPWGDLKGRPLDSRRLANMLKQYGITSTQLHTATINAKGYRAEDFYDAWQRYLPVSPKSETSETCETSGTASSVQEQSNVSHVSHVSVPPDTDQELADEDDDIEREAIQW